MTLLELLLSMLMISAMLIAVWAIYSTGVRVFYGQVARYDIKDRANLAFITMTGELQQAISVTAATATSVTFTVDLNSDGVSETIQYTWSGTAGAPLNRVVGAVTTALIPSVQTITFSYFNTGNVLLTAPITLASVHLVAIDSTTMSGQERFYLRTKVFLQNI